MATKSMDLGHVTWNDSVRYDAAQSLTDDQKTQARDNINAAPGGFGLGGDVVNAPRNENEGFSDANLITATGFYRALGNVPYGGVLRCYITHLQIDTRSALQFAAYSSDETYALREKTQAGWGEWEYINPPMEVGVEYRTTERFEGKRVYVQLIKFGYGPNNSNAHVTKTIENIDTIVRWSGTASDGTAFPFANHMYSPAHVLDGIVYKDSNELHIDLYTNENKSEVNLYVSVFYTKNPD